MRRTVVVPFLLLVVGLAGCLGGDDDTVDYDENDLVREPGWANRAIFLDADPEDTDRIVDHDHSDASIHRGLSTPNFQVLGHDPLLSNHYGGVPAGAYWCGEASGAGNDRRIAVAVSIRTDVALSVLDVTDPAAPHLLGELVMPQYTVYDVAIFDDGQYAVVPATYKVNDLLPLAAPSLTGSIVPAPEGPAIFWRDACTGLERPLDTQDDGFYTEGTFLIDLSEPSAPAVAAFFPDHTRNMHSVSVMEEDDGTKWVVASSLHALTTRGLQPDEVPPVPQRSFGNLLSHFTFFQVQETPLGPQLVPWGYYSGAFFGDPEVALDIARWGNFHVDGTLQVHPLTGDLIGYLANWEGGFATVRLNRDLPGSVELLDTFYQAQGTGLLGEAPDPATAQMTGAAHTAVPLPDTEIWGGRHITIWGQEVISRPGGRPTGEIILTDTSDPANIIPVARWTLPVDVQWNECCTFSTHYPIMVEDTMFVAMYHGGFWAVDAREKFWPELPSIGVFLPDGDAPEPYYPSAAPQVLEGMDLGGGVLGVLDGNTGYYTVQWTGAHRDVPPSQPWIEDAWI